MSNARKPQGKPNSLARYRSEVKGIEPFKLWLDDDECIEIATPNTDQMMAAEEAYREGTSRDVITAFCGDKAEEFLAALGKEDPRVTWAVIADMREHFGLGE